MKSYLLRWSEGDLSLVMATDEVEAMMVMDELGDPSEGLVEITDPMAIHLKLADDGRFEVADWSHLFDYTVMSKLYPHLYKALVGGEDENGRNGDDQEAIRRAVEKERVVESSK